MNGKQWILGLSQAGQDPSENTRNHIHEGTPPGKRVVYVMCYAMQCRVPRHADSWWHKPCWGNIAFIHILKFYKPDGINVFMSFTNLHIVRNQSKHGKKTALAQQKKRAHSETFALTKFSMKPHLLFNLLPSKSTMWSRVGFINNPKPCFLSLFCWCQLKVDFCWEEDTDRQGWEGVSDCQDQ